MRGWRFRLLRPGQRWPAGLTLSGLARRMHAWLQPYTDRTADIRRCLKYAMDRKRGGRILLAQVHGDWVGVAVVNYTGMKGYIPGRVLVYLAVTPSARGQGLGTELLRRILRECRGDCKLHVEYENPARRLYERFGFRTKYAEYRLKR